VQFDQPLSPWRLCVAPMMEWSDRHCRFFHRLLTRHARLYTEMVTTGALLHGDVPRHLDFNAEEHPVALQLGGSEPADLAACARLGERWGYDEINLNCGCPSPRVQRGAFGACLMAEPALVADCVKAMRDAVALPVTVKHRIGIDRTESYAFVRDFVGCVAQAGCSVFIVHARNAWLHGLAPDRSTYEIVQGRREIESPSLRSSTGASLRRLSPKENREVPPLRLDVVHRLKRDFPGLTFVSNGGLTRTADIEAQLSQVDGVMLGREAYHHPWSLADWDERFFDAAPRESGRAEIELKMVQYMETLTAKGIPWPHAARHMLGLWNGTPGARRWRQVWSDHRLKLEAPRRVWQLAQRPVAEVEGAPL
jgi:tRNA-dihydrouridine synthase A